MTPPTQTRPKREQFKQAEQQWDLERLYRDLANAKGQHLTAAEMLHLRGLLCGHSPSEIADKLSKGLNSVENGLSTVYSYIKELPSVGKKIGNWRNVSQYLEEAGYKKPLTVVSSNQLPEITLPIKSLAGLEGLITIVNQHYSGNNQKVFEINIRLVVSVPEEGKMEDSSSSE